jgi:CO dehydrogenase maturation factor
MPELIAERTGTYPGSMGGFFKLNPKVNDLPDKLAAVQDSIKLLVLGTVEKGGGGCICPESALLKALLNHIVLERDEAVIMDMEAGIEHLGRATAMGVDALIIVVEPGLRSVQTAQKISKLADDIKIKKKLLVLNKIRDWREEENLRSKLLDLTFIGSVAELEEIREADFKGEAPFDVSNQFVSQIKKIRAKLANALAKPSQGQINREVL